MNTKKSIYIVHSHELNEHGDPKQEYKSRLDKIWEISKKSSEEIDIILTGWKATKWIDLRHCDSGYKYLVSLWINPNNVFREIDSFWSLETVWEAIFVARDYFDLINKYNFINLISSDYHQKRILEINKFILWNSRVLKFTWVSIEKHGNTNRTIKQEEASLNAFFRTFEWIEKANISEIENRLWKNHPLYKNHPSNPYNKS